MQSIETIFMFCNSASGGGRAGRFLALPLAARTFANLRVEMVDLLSKESREAGYLLLQQHCNSLPARPTIVICAGGDGTVKWMIEDIKRHNCVHQVVIGVIPFGTGNDLARVLGWGAHAPLRITTQVFQQLVLDFHKYGQRIDMDVWQVEIKTQKRKWASRSTNREDPAKELMINYLSVGQDAKTVYNFELHRRGSQTANKLQFAVEGGLVSLPSRFSKKVQLKQAVLALDGSQVQGVRMRQGLIFQNIPSYAAGSDFWKQTKWNPQHSLFAPQMIGDRKLEVHNLHQVIDIGLHKATLGMRRATAKIGQSTTTKLDFAHAVTANTDVYVQIDGESCKLTGAQSLEITPAFQISVLKRNIHRKVSTSTLHESFCLHTHGVAGEIWQECFAAIVEHSSEERVLKFGANKQVILVGSSTSVIDHVGGPRPNSSFAVTCSAHKTYRFATASSEERDAWVKALLQSGSVSKPASELSPRQRFGRASIL